MASIKPNDNGSHAVKMQIAPGGRFVGKNLIAKMLPMQAFDVRNFQIGGAPGRTESEHFDIEAKTEGDRNVKHEQMRGMLKALLVERFNLETAVDYDKQRLLTRTARLAV